MTFKDIAKKVSSAAPLIGSVLAGRAGETAGVLLSGLFGCENTPDAIDAAISLDPDAMLKIRDLEFTHSEQLSRIALEEEVARLGDVKNARDREIEITKAMGARDFNLYALAWLVIIGFFVLMGIMIFTTMSQANIGPVNQLFGALATGFGMVLQYFFGSSKSSAQKTALLAERGK